MAEDPSAVLLIRVWLEGEERAFRARLSAMSGPRDEAARERTIAVAATARDVVVAVERWLADFVAGGESGT